MGVYLNSKNPYGMFLDEAASMYFIDKSEMLLELLPMVEKATVICALPGPAVLEKQ